MGSRRTRIVPMCRYDFSSLIFGTQQKIIIAEHVNVAECSQAVVDVRVHAITLTGGTISIQAQLDGFTWDDPGVNFLKTVAVFSSALPPFAPYVQPEVVSFPGEYVAFSLLSNKNFFGPLAVTISVDLVERILGPAEAPAATRF